MEQPVAATFADITTAYAKQVVDGKIPACKYHQLACHRHLKDLARAGTEAFPYLWNPALTDKFERAYYPAERVCKFAELMPHIKGDWAARRELIKLMPWQIFILASIFGWIHRDTLKRRFREADIVVPRKNAKSTLAAVIGLYMLALDGEFGAEVYSGATSKDQAMEVFRPALLMTRATPRFVQTYGISVNVSNLSIPDNNSKFEPVIGSPGDGSSPSCAIVDEYHEHKTPELYNTMLTGMGARSQPLILIITTAGSDISGPCYQHLLELQKVLEGVLNDEHVFFILFTIDSDEDWTTEAALIKANPNYDVSVDGEFLRQQQIKAKNDPRLQNTFKTKHLNIWVGAASPWLNLTNLQKSGDPTLTLNSEPWDGVIAGVDLSSKQDIASAVFLCWQLKDRVRYYTAFSRNYAPEAAVMKDENAHYQAWRNGGHLIVTPGNMISLEHIQEDLIDICGTFAVREVAKDPWGGHQLGANLQAEDIDVVDIPQQTRYLSDPMKEIAALVDAGRFRHDANPCYLWMLSNVECVADRNDNVFPRKARATNKIDGAVATIIAMQRALARAEEDFQGVVIL